MGSYHPISMQIGKKTKKEMLGLISKSQHAFIKQHSTATNLLASLHDWSIGLNSHLCTDIVYIDFSRAFDSIALSKLLFKLELYGITGKLLNWDSQFFI
jgi:hypothetical protein